MACGVCRVIKYVCLRCADLNSSIPLVFSSACLLPSLLFFLRQILFSSFSPSFSPPIPSFLLCFCRFDTAVRGGMGMVAFTQALPNLLLADRKEGKISMRTSSSVLTFCVYIFRRMRKGLVVTEQSCCISDGTAVPAPRGPY